jgi:alkylation response protein AidB-like acyl-CoA dehydrogenase
MDAQKRLPQRLVNELKDAGVFRMTMPKSWGGAELDPLAQLRIIEKLAEADASVAWCVMVGCDSGFFSGFIDQDVARKMYSDIDLVTASALTTIGRANKVDGGYEVSGRLPFSSGCHHSDWFVLGCQVYQGDQLCVHPNGTPITRQCFVPANAVTILDTWHTTGLRGTGSNDLTVSKVFVPTEQSFSFQELNFYRDQPLYRFPMNILLNFSSVPIGVANAALNAICACGEKPSRLTVINNELTLTTTLREQPFVQDTVGRARAMLASVRAYLYASVGELWSTIEDGQEIPPHQFADFQLVHTHVFETCTEVVRLLYKVRGGSAVYEGNDLDRCLRDLLAMNQHVVNSLRSYSAGGRILLGLPPEQILL